MGGLKEARTSDRTAQLGRLFHCTIALVSLQGNKPTLKDVYPHINDDILQNTFHCEEKDPNLLE